MLETVVMTRTMEFIPNSRSSRYACTCWWSMRTRPCARLRRNCSQPGYAVESAGDMTQARSMLRGSPADILLVNLRRHEQGLELVSEVKLSTRRQRSSP